MKTIAERVQDFLRKFPKSRERKFKDKAIIHMLVERYGYQDGVPAKALVSFVQDYASYDRAWRQVLHDHPALRGTDYDGGKRLEQENMIELGYEVGHESDVRSLRKIK